VVFVKEEFVKTVSSKDRYIIFANGYFRAYPVACVFLFPAADKPINPIATTV
jgi:hypothetical protein